VGSEPLIYVEGKKIIKFVLGMLHICKFVIEEMLINYTINEKECRSYEQRRVRL
jgi:hypothetical protein